MPYRPPTYCAQPGCPALSRTRYCPRHAKAAWKQYDAQSKRQYDANRPSSTQRGYGIRWQRLRLMVLREEPLCRQCSAPSTDVDHITPRARGGDDSRANLQGLCHRCHSRKTLEHDGRWQQRGAGESPKSRSLND